jgi:hypothetical protein
MERAERAALYLFLIGLGVAVSAVAGPLAFNLPKAFSQILFCVGAVLAIIPAGFLANEYRHIARAGRVLH